MLTKIGFSGGSSVFSLGTTSDIDLFFSCISFYVKPKYPKQDWSVLTDRFFRRYLRLDEVNNAVTLMKLVEEEFKQLDNDTIDTDEIKSGKIKSDLDLTQKSLFDIFNDYFHAFYYCVESAKVNYEGFKLEDPNHKYEPVMVAFATIPYLVSYQQIPLSVFDELKPDDKPIWWTGKLPK